MRIIICTIVATLVLVSGPIARGQAKARTLVAVWAHADDEGPVAPILARYAREGVQVHMIIATVGAQGAANTSVPRGPEIAKLRAEEARCSARGTVPDRLRRHNDRSQHLVPVIGRIADTEVDPRAVRQNGACVRVCAESPLAVILPHAGIANAAERQVVNDRLNGAVVD